MSHRREVSIHTHTLSVLSLPYLTIVSRSGGQAQSGALVLQHKAHALACSC